MKLVKVHTQFSSLKGLKMLHLKVILKIFFSRGGGGKRMILISLLGGRELCTETYDSFYALTLGL